jgi:hypothetical protein
MRRSFSSLVCAESAWRGLAVLSQFDGTFALPERSPRGDKMLKALATATVILAAASSHVQAQTDLTAYADANGYIDVQALTCAALAGTWQGDADRLTTWYSGWYNGLAKKHYFNIARSKELEHEVIVYCKANPQIRIIEAIDVMLNQEKHKAAFK